MKNNLLTWKEMLSELNDVSCKIEFLQCQIRRNISERKTVNINEYLNSLSKIVQNHDKKLRHIFIDGSKYLNEMSVYNLEQKKTIHLEGIKTTFH